MGKTLLIILGLVALCTARVYENNITLSTFRSKGGWFFLTKMTFGKGEAHVTIQTKVSGTPIASVSSIDFFIVSQENWQAELERKCASPTPSVKLPQNLSANGEVTSQDYTLEVPKQTMYYFLMKDCPGLLIKEYSNSKLFLNVKLTILNNKSHLSNDEDCWFIFPLMLAIGAWLAYRNRQFDRQGDEFDWAQLLLFVAIITNLVGLFWKGFSYLVYSSSGNEYAIFDIFYMLLHSLSETVMICLICLVAYGWTINYLYGQDFDIYIPLMAMLGMFNVIITVLNKINDSEHDKYHMYDSIPGYLLVGFRCILIVIFLIGIILTYNKSNPKKHQFIMEFGILGTIFIASLPLMLLYVDWLVNKNNQKQFLFISVQILKALSAILLTYMLTSKKSDYAKISYRSMSFLPQNEKFF